MTIAFNFRQRIVQKVVAMDYRLSLAEHRKGQSIDYLRLPALLSAATSCANAVDSGEEPEAAFQARFEPTTAYRNLASLVGLKLIVRDGRWMEELCPARSSASGSLFAGRVGSTLPT
jgi:hypothetical protein